MRGLFLDTAAIDSARTLLCEMRRFLLAATPLQNAPRLLLLQPADLTCSTVSAAKFNNKQRTASAGSYVIRSTTVLHTLIYSVRSRISRAICNWIVGFTSAKVSKQFSLHSMIASKSRVKISVVDAVKLRVSQLHQIRTAKPSSPRPSE